MPPGCPKWASLRKPGWPMPSARGIMVDGGLMNRGLLVLFAGLAVIAGCEDDKKVYGDSDTDSDTETETDSHTDTDTYTDLYCDNGELKCAVDDDCLIGYYCNNGCCFDLSHPECVADFQCYKEFGRLSVCEDGACVRYAECIDDWECTASEFCLEGWCYPQPDCTSVAVVQIVTPPGAVRTGVSRQFKAQALNANGEVVAGMRFRWTSSNPEVAEIGEFTGLATGGELSGQTDINAHLICDEQ